MKYAISATGTRALLIHNSQLANPMNPYAKAMKAISSKRKKSDEDFADLARIEFEGSLYFDAEIGPYIPDHVLFASIVEGAKLNKLGKAVERAFIGLDSDKYPILYRGPRTVDGLWADPSHVDQRVVGVMSNKVVRTRPIFRSWALEFNVEFDEVVLNPQEVHQVVTNAGLYAGLGDYRKLYGRYSVEIETL
jgi:hypothetical protein